MSSAQRPGRRSTDAGGTSESRALDRYEDEGGPGPDDMRDRRRDSPMPTPTGDRDVVDPGRVVVTPGSTAAACRIHHRDIPELHADGATPREAADNLARDLSREIECATDHYHRGLFGGVLEDVRAFAAQVP